MTKPSKGASLFLILFSLPFLGFGLVGFFVFLRQATQKQAGNPFVAAMFSLVFVIIGGGLFFAAIYGYYKLKQQAAVEQQNPGSPWLWRQDWMASRSNSQNRDTAIGWWIAATLCNLITVPVALSALLRFQETSDPKLLIPLGFSLIGLILLFAAVRATIRRQRFGKTYFEFHALPFSPGRPLRGAIHLRLNTSVERGVKLQLSCIRKITTGNGDSRTTNQVTLWQSEQMVSPTALMPGPFDTAIPVEFSLPVDSYETNHDNSNDQLLWLLHAEANVPGVDYSDTFEVPVFRTSRSPENLESVSFSSNAPGMTFAGNTAFQSDDSEAPAPATTKIMISTASDGATEFYWPPFRHPAQCLFLLGFSVAWTGIVYLLAHSKAPLIFALFFGFFDFLLIYGVLYSLFGSARISVGNGNLRYRRGIFPGSLREIPFADIDWILPIMPLQQSTGTKGANYSIRLWTKHNRKILLADAMTREESRWIVTQMESLVGLKRDVHMELDSLYVNSPPPQRARGTTAN